jgi:hypothetical protein
MQFQALFKVNGNFESAEGATLELRSLDTGRHFVSPILKEGGNDLAGVEVSNCLLTDAVISPHRFGNGSTFVRRWFTVLRASVALTAGPRPRHVLIRQQPGADAHENESVLLWVPGIDLELGECQGEVQQLMKGLYRLTSDASAQLLEMDRAATVFGRDTPKNTFTVSWELKEGRRQICVDGVAAAQTVLWR